MGRPIAPRRVRVAGDLMLEPEEEGPARRQCARRSREHALVWEGRLARAASQPSPTASLTSNADSEPIAAGFGPRRLAAVRTVSANSTA
jgi:hypothetical protein